MDIEVRNGCVSIESGFFMDVEVRIECSADPSARRVGLQVFQRHPGVANGASDRSSARRPCPQMLQGHPRVAKSHLSKDKPVSARCKDQLSYCRAYRQTCRMVSYASLTDRQTGPPYLQPYLKLSPAGSHGSSLPDGFIRQTYRQVSFQRPDRPPSPAIHPGKARAGLPYR